MSHRFFTAVFLASTLCIGTSFAANPAKSGNTTATPVAFVYVTSNYTGQTNRILGYSVASNGKLTAVPYSPFSHDVVQMAVNGKYLFAAGNNSTSSNIYSFSIGPHGYLTLAKLTEVVSVLPAAVNFFTPSTHS